MILKVINLLSDWHLKTKLLLFLPSNCGSAGPSVRPSHAWLMTRRSRLLSLFLVNALFQVFEHFPLALGLLLFCEFLEVLVRVLQVSLVNDVVSLSRSWVLLRLVVKEVVVLVFFRLLAFRVKVYRSHVQVITFVTIGSAVLVPLSGLFELSLSCKHLPCGSRVVHQLVPFHYWSIFVLRV